MQAGGNMLHYAKFIGFLALVLMIWLTTDNRQEPPRFSDGQPKITGAYVNGKAEGTWTWWYENGKKMTEGNFIEGKRNGIWQTWYEGGQKKSESIYVDDRLNGLCTQWYKNGKMKQHGKYRQDKREGPHRYYDTAGQLQSVRVFADGMPLQKE